MASDMTSVPMEGANNCTPGESEITGLTQVIFRTIFYRDMFAIVMYSIMACFHLLKEGRLMGGALAFLYLLKAYAAFYYTGAIIPSYNIIFLYQMYLPVKLRGWTCVNFLMYVVSVLGHAIEYLGGENKTLINLGVAVSLVIIYLTYLDQLNRNSQGSLRKQCEKIASQVAIMTTACVLSTVVEIDPAWAVICYTNYVAGRVKSN